MTLVPLPSHGIAPSGETVTVAPGMAALYASHMSWRVTGLAACLIVVLMTFSNAVTGSSSSASLPDTWASRARAGEAGKIESSLTPAGQAAIPARWARLSMAAW